MISIPAARVSPKIAVLTDEVEIDNLLQEEIRAVCNRIAELRATSDPGTGPSAP